MLSVILLTPCQYVNQRREWILGHVFDFFLETFPAGFCGRENLNHLRTYRAQRATCFDPGRATPVKASRSTVWAGPVTLVVAEQSAIVFARIDYRGSFDVLAGNKGRVRDPTGSARHRQLLAEREPGVAGGSVLLCSR